MKFFDYQRYLLDTEALTNVAASGDEFAADDIKYVESFMGSCYEYVRHVDEMETAIRLAKFHLDPEAYRERIQELDGTRRVLHNGIIANLHTLGKILAAYGLPAFFSGDIADRYQVADFCGEVSDTIFKNRQS